MTAKRRVSGGWWMLSLLLVAPVSAQDAAPGGEALQEARKGFKTRLTREVREGEPLAQPHPRFFSRVGVPTPIGVMGAYLGKPPGPGKHPAMIWITGGFPPGGVDESAWVPVPDENDQSAKAYREAGMVMMYPTFRGSFGNPGLQEAFYGEVDDVLAAAEYLAQVDFVDPQRIYLGGHSTGGTLALLAAAATDRFRGVIAFGPVADVVSYGDDVLPFDLKNPQEGRLRAPIRYLGGLECPVYVLEGTGDPSNGDDLELLRKASKHPRVRFAAIQGANHFSVLAPLNRFFARRIAGAGDGDPLDVTEADLQAAFDAHRVAVREAFDLETLARLRRGGMDFKAPRRVQHFLLSRDRASLEAAAEQAKAAGFRVGEPEQEQGPQGTPFFVLTCSTKVVLGDLVAVFAVSQSLSLVVEEHGLQYGGWEAE